MLLPCAVIGMAMETKVCRSTKMESVEEWSLLLLKGKEGQNTYAHSPWEWYIAGSPQLPARTVFEKVPHGETPYQGGESTLDLVFEAIFGVSSVGEEMNFPFPVTEKKILLSFYFEKKTVFPTKFWNLVQKPPAQEKLWQIFSLTFET